MEETEMTMALASGMRAFREHGHPRLFRSAALRNPYFSRSRSEAWAWDLGWRLAQFLAAGGGK